MRRTLLVSCFVVSVFGCADAQPSDSGESVVLAAEGPWIDEPLAPPTGPEVPDVASADEGVSEDEDEGGSGPWIDPALPPKTSTQPSGQTGAQGPWLDPQLPPKTGASAPSSTGAARYDFERDTQGWSSSGLPVIQVERSTAQRASGAASLAMRVDGDGMAQASVPRPALRAGAIVSFRVFIPAGARLRWIQPFVQQDASANWAWTGRWHELAGLRQNGWNTITVQVPANARSFNALGVQLQTEGSWRGSIFVDDVRF